MMIGYTINGPVVGLESQIFTLTLSRWNGVMMDLQIMLIGYMVSPKLQKTNIPEIHVGLLIKIVLRRMLIGQVSN